MRDDGLSSVEIGTRINKSSGRVEQILEWTTIPRHRPPQRRSPRAIENRVLALRSVGESHEVIARRFNKSERYIRQVEGLAHYRIGIEQLRVDRTVPR